MKQTLLKVLKILFFVAVVVIVILLIFGGVLFLDWPWWVGFFVLLGFIGVCVALWVLKKIWSRRREQDFVDQIIEQDEAQLKHLAERDRVEAKELQNRWKEAIGALQRSHLRKRGNPLYVLPWYLIIGESGAGKTTAIQSARLSSSFAEVTRISGISGTRNCDWWFFEQAILIDTAGRYTIRVDEERDKEEWQRFLTLLAKYRQKEPINGLIVSVAADKLLTAAPETLGEDARSVRRRIDELMRVLGAKFPVYLLVTKCDLAQGMTQFCNQFPEKSLDQAMGHVNQDLSTDVVSFLDTAFERIGERLRDLRLLILNHCESKKVDPPLLLFPEEFEKLRPGLESFMKIAFQQNPYQETPIFRGLYFSSGRQEGTPYSHFLNALGLLEEKDILPGTNKGLFLHDFFSKILPRDRGLFAPTKRALEWSRITRNLGLTSWIAVGLAICGLLSFSFVKNLRTLRLVTHEFTERAEFRGEILTDMMTLDRFRLAILKVEEANRGWFIPRFYLNQSLEVEILLKEFYCRQFQKSFLSAFDEQMFARIAGFSLSTPDAVVGQHVSHLVRRINLLKARLAGHGLSTLQGKPQPSYDPALAIATPVTAPIKKDLFGLLYLYYLVWRQDLSQLNTEATMLQKWFDHVLTVERNIHWLVGWANALPTLSPVTMEQFWGGSQPLKDEVLVARAFTRQGKKEMDTFIAEMEEALVAPQILAPAKAEFTEWYQGEYLKAWNDFLVFFPKGVDRLRGRDEWQKMASRVATDDGPYFSVLARSGEELEPFALNRELPGWQRLLHRLQLVRAQLSAETLAQEKGLLGKAAEKGRQIITDLEKTVSKVPGISFESQAKAVQAYRDYVAALSNLSKVSESTKLSYDITFQVFSQDEVTGQAPFFAATRAGGALKSVLSAGSLQEEPFWKVANGPLDFLWTYMRKETACHLQKRWEEEVIAETLGVSDSLAALERLVGENGFAWKFVKGTAAPFVGRNPNRGGYYATDVKGDNIAMEKVFFEFLNKGSSIPAAIAAYKKGVADRAAAEAAAKAAAATAGGGGGGPDTGTGITIYGLPTHANPDAQRQPHATHLTLHCHTGPQRLSNFNYDCSKTFKYSPEICQDVMLEIDVGNVRLVRTWGGAEAFRKFLRSFPRGERTFRAEDFPEAVPELERMGIRHITVRYRILGSPGGPPKPKEPVLPKVPEVPKLATPNKIAVCWDN